MKTFKPLLLSLVLLFPTSRMANAAKPKWVKKRPSERDYYIGIGQANKSDKQNADYAREARSKALKEMASEIEVTVSANSLLQQFEDNYAFKETFQSNTSTSVEQNLTGYEVQTWENQREYWVLVRLNKANYQRQKREKLEMAKRMAASYLFGAREHLKNKEITLALASYFKAIQALEKHLDDDLSYRTVEGSIHFGTDLMNELQQLFSKITITPKQASHFVEFSKNMDSPLTVKVEYSDESGESVPVHNFPLKFDFSMGEGLLQSQPATNPTGEASCYIQKLISHRKKQAVTATFDFNNLLKQENVNSPLVGFFIPVETVPQATIPIELNKADAEFLPHEIIFDTPANTAPFANQLKAELNNLFFNFTSTPEEAKYKVTVNVTFSKGEIKQGKGYTVYLVFADLYFTIISTQDQTEIFSDALLGIKGMRPGSFDYAMKEARQKLLDQFNQKILPKLEVIDL